MIGSSNDSPNVIGSILMLHSQKKYWLWTLQCTPQPKKFLAVEPSICATAKNSFGCGICTDSENSYGPYRMNYIF